MTTNENYTTIGGWVAAIQKAVENAGFDFTPVLKQVGLTGKEHLDPEYRVTADKLNRLMELAGQLTGDPCFAIRIAQHAHPSTFSLLGYSLLAADTLKTVLEKLARYKRVVSNTCSLTIETDDRSVLLKMHAHQDEKGKEVLSNLAVMTFLCTVLRFMRDLSRQDFSPLQLNLNFPEPHYHTMVSEFFGCPIVYGQVEISMAFERSLLEKQLPTADTLVTQLHEKLLIEKMARLEEENLEFRIRAKIMDSLALGVPSQQEIAETMNMSLRNLQRKLAEQGTCFKEILDETRKELAMQYIKQTDVSLGEISYLLGFSSVANFSRAFKRWADDAPGHYREHIAEQEEKETEKV